MIRGMKQEASSRKQKFAVAAVVFDLYGTLIRISEPRRPYRQLARHLNQECGVLPDDAARIFMTVDESFAEMLVRMQIRLQASAIEMLKRDLEAELLGIEAFSDVDEVLRGLRSRGFLLAFCSNLAKPYVAPAERLLPRADASAYSCRLGVMKPDARIYNELCAALGVAPTQAVMVGDTLATDVDGPLAVGMNAIHLVRDGRKTLAPTSIRSLTELPSLLMCVAR